MRHLWYLDARVGPELWVSGALEAGHGRDQRDQRVTHPFCFSPAPAANSHRDRPLGLPTRTFAAICRLIGRKVSLIFTRQLSVLSVI